MQKALKILGICAGVLLSLVLLTAGGVQIALMPSNGNALLSRITPSVGAIDAKYDSIELSIIRSWPYIDLKLSGVLVKTKVFSEPDTLAFIKNLDARFNLGSFIINGDVRLSHLFLYDANIKALHRDSIYSWDITPPSDDTTASAVPDIYIDTLSVVPLDVTFTDFDSRFSATAKGIDIDAAHTELISDLKRLKSRLKVQIDSVAYADTTLQRNCMVRNFALDLNAFRDEVQTNLLLFNAKSDDIALRDSMFNIERTSVEIYLQAIADSTFRRFSIDTLGARLDETTLMVKGVVSPDMADTLSVEMENLRVEFNCPSIWRLNSFVPSKFSKYVEPIVFDGAVAMQVSANGLYRGRSLPVVEASLQVNRLNGGVKRYKQRIDNITIDAVGRYNQDCPDSTYVKVNNIDVKSDGNTINGSGMVCYKMGKEYLDLSLLANLNLRSLNDLYKFDPRQRMKGLLKADVNGSFFLEDVEKMNLYKIFSSGTVTGDGIGVLIPSYKLGVYVDSLRLNVNTNTSTGRRKLSASDSLRRAENMKKIMSRTANTLKKTERYRYDANDTVLLDTRLAFKSLNVWYKRRVKAKSERFYASLLADDIEPGKVPRFRTLASFRGVDILLDDSVKFVSKRISASLNVGKNSINQNLPQSSVRLSLDSVVACSARVCATLDTTRIALSATPRLRIGRRRGKSKAQIDSMKVAASKRIVDMPALIALFDTIMKADEPMELYMKRFNNEGTFYSRRMRMKDADFPLRVGLSRLDLELNDDTIKLNNVRPRIGRSAVTLSGEVTNFRRYLLRGRTLSGNLQVKSKRIDLNQIMRALYEYNKKRAEREALAMSGEEMAEAVEMNAIDVASEVDDSELELASDSVDMMGLLVLPKNLDLKMNAYVDTMLFSGMRLEDFQGDVTIKDSRLKIKELSTSTQVGKANMNVMYECAVPDSARATLALAMDSIQVGDLVTYIPELDSLLPMLRSFSGRVECDASTELTLDEQVNVVLPSVNAALRVRGDSMVLLDGETFTTIAKYLNFSKKTENRIDSISVEVTVQNNEVLIYPFMVSMDKYRLGVGGKQNLDLSFNYHIVVLRPAILSIAGLDVYGKDFDHIRFKLTSPKFKGFDVAIGKGGKLVSTSEVNLRKLMYDTMLEAILKEE